MDNRTFAHNFFYEKDQYEYKKHNSMAYQGRDFFSYVTQIAHIVENKKKEKFLLLSWNNFSSTTSKHIYLVASACPYPIIYVPGLKMDSQYNLNDNPEQTIGYFTESMDFYIRLDKFTRQENRWEFETVYKNYKQFLTAFTRKKPLKKYTEFYETITNDEKVKELKEAQREKDRVATEEAKEVTKKLREKLGYLGCIKILCSYEEMRKLPEKTVKALKKVYDFSKYAYVYPFSDDEIKTSKGIRMDKDKVKVALKAWLKNKIHHGETIDGYTILSITSAYVKIGCHTIPVKNLHELAKYYNLEN